MRLLAAEPRSIAGLLFPCQYLCGTIYSDPVFDGVGLAGFKSRANALLLAWQLASFLSPAVFPSFFFILWVGIVGLGSSD